GRAAAAAAGRGAADLRLRGGAERGGLPGGAAPGLSRVRDRAAGRLPAGDGDAAGAEDRQGARAGGDVGGASLRLGGGPGAALRAAGGGRGGGAREAARPADVGGGGIDEAPAGGLHVEGAREDGGEGAGGDRGAGGAGAGRAVAAGHDGARAADEADDAPAARREAPGADLHAALLRVALRSQLLPEAPGDARPLRLLTSGYYNIIIL